MSRTKYGTNKVTHEKKQSLAKRLAGAFINPFTAILFCLAVVSTMTDMVFPYFSLVGSSPEDFDPLTVVIILTMVMISGTLRFVQESRSGNAAEKLLSMITTTCTVTRREQEKIEIPMDNLVVGDIVHLSAGDMIPADVRILDANDLFISQASLTGESEPVEKTPKVATAAKEDTPPTAAAALLMTATRHMAAIPQERPTLIPIPTVQARLQAPTQIPTIPVRLQEQTPTARKMFPPAAECMQTELQKKALPFLL